MWAGNGPGILEAAAIDCWCPGVSVVLEPFDRDGLLLCAGNGAEFPFPE